MRIFILSIFILTVFGCDRAPEGDTDPEFSFQDEMILSDLMLTEILNNPSSYGEILIDTNEQYVYAFLDRIKDSLIRSAQIQNPNKYDWEFFVIEDSFDASAYAIPGGRIFISSGLILYMNGEDELSAVIGREMYYLDRGLALNKILKVYGIPLTLETFNDTNQFNIPPMIDIMRNQAYSLDNERNGDLITVDLLCQKVYKNDALANLYFRSLQDTVSILNKNFVNYFKDSTRVNSIYNKAQESDCKGSISYTREYGILLDSLKY